MLNSIIFDQFKLLVKQIKLDIDMTSGKEQMINMFRLKSIEQVLKILEKFPDNITSSDQLKNIKNVGKKSLLRIDEILKSGKLSEIKISTDINKYLEIISSLEDVFGIGRKKAYELFKKYNITSIDDLKDKYNKKEIDLPDNIVKGLKYVGKIREKIPRSEIDLLAIQLSNISIEIDPKLFLTVCGSYRRENITSNDIDVILIHPSYKTLDQKNKINYLEKFVNLLKLKGLLLDSLTSDDVSTKYMGILSSFIRIDIRFIPYNSFYPAILYFTGSKDFNRKMRQVALSNDYVLNEYGLYYIDNDKQKSFDIKSEKQIFDLLSMEYVLPKNR